jgi:uncharacterized protein YgiM (DUF1202 family)
VVCFIGITDIGGILMKKRLIALLLVLMMLVPAGIASAATYYRVNTTSLVVRMQPGTSSKALATYKKDTACTVSKTENGWSYATFMGGTTGWVQAKYLSKGSSYSAWVAYDNTQLRPKANGSGSLATLAKGTKVSVLAHGASYDYVKAGDFGYGYIINSRLSKKQVKASGSKSTSNVATGGNYDAWVLIASGHTVNLYKTASTNSAKIASYGAGTKVHVVSHGSKFDKVTVDGNTGYMLTAYLNRSEPAPTPTPKSGSGSGSSSYTAYTVSGNKKAVHVRKGAGKGFSVSFDVPYGAAVTVLKHNSKWDYIQYNGKKGYIDNSFLQLAKPKDAGEAVITPTPKPATPVPYTAIVNINNLNFHKQKGDWSSNVDGVGRLQLGDTVEVLAVSGDWAKVKYNEYTGWVHKKFLN